MANGKMNWAGLLGYTVQPSDMELFQTYMQTLTKGFIASERTKGILFGGRITTVSGMQLKVSEGLALMPDGTLVSFPETTFIISTAPSGNPRIDRIEISYAAINNTTVQDINSNSLTLDVVYTPSINVTAGTPASTPSAPAANSARLTLGFISVGIAQSAILAGDIAQTEGTSFESSAIQLGNKNGFIRMNQTNAAIEFSTDGSQWSKLGAGGGGGGGGASWQPVDGLAPGEAIEYGEKSFLFSQGSLQKASLWVKVPSSYLPSSPISMLLGHYSPSATLDYRFSVVSTLIRKNIDPISSTTNQYTSTNSDSTNTVAYRYVEKEYDLTSAIGVIGSEAVAPGDLILVQIERVAPSGTEDANDVRMIPSSTEIHFS